MLIDSTCPLISPSGHTLWVDGGGGCVIQEAQGECCTAVLSTLFHAQITINSNYAALVVGLGPWVRLTARCQVLPPVQVTIDSNYAALVVGICVLVSNQHHCPAFSQWWLRDARPDLLNDLCSPACTFCLSCFHPLLSLLRNSKTYHGWRALRKLREPCVRDLIWGRTPLCLMRA